MKKSIDFITYLLYIYSLDKYLEHDGTRVMNILLDNLPKRLIEKYGEEWKVSLSPLVENVRTIRIEREGVCYIISTMVVFTNKIVFLREITSLKRNSIMQIDEVIRFLLDRESKHMIEEPIKIVLPLLDKKMASIVSASFMEYKLKGNK